MVEAQIGASSPVILGFPHTGTDVPDDIWERLNDTGRMLTDTDWHIHELYEGLLPDATTVRATFHRYVIDANRDPAGVSLYPGQNTTGLDSIDRFRRHADLERRRGAERGGHRAARLARSTRRIMRRSRPRSSG